VIDDDRISAFLDGELPPSAVAEFEAEMTSSPSLTAEVESFAAVRNLLRNGAGAQPRAGAMERIVAIVSADTLVDDRADDVRAGPAAVAPVVELSRRRRVPVLATAAASFVIIASVVGGLGGSTTLPAVGDLVARHAAAAAAESMPSGDDDVMSEVKAEGPSVPSGYEIAHASRDGSVTHLVYSGPGGSMVSIFQQEGDTDVSMIDDEMGKGELSEMGGQPMWSGSIGDTHVAVLDGNGYLFTVVGDADHDTMEVMMADLPSRDPGFSARLSDAADVIVEPFRLGW